MSRRAQRSTQTLRRIQINLRRLGFVSNGRQAVDSTSLDILHFVSANAGIVPVAKVNGPVRRNRYVRGAKPGIGRAHGVLRLQRKAGAIRRQKISFYISFTGLGVDQLATVFFRQQFTFINHQATGSPGAGARDIGNHTRKFGMKMRPLVFTPAPTARTPISEVPSFHDIVDPNPGVPIIVVVGLPDIAKGIQRQFVGIAKIMTENCEVRPVRIDTECTAGIVRPRP